MPRLFRLWVSGEKYVLAAHTRDVSGIPRRALMEVGALSEGEEEVERVRRLADLDERLMMRHRPGQVINLFGH